MRETLKQRSYFGDFEAAGDGFVAAAGDAAGVVAGAVAGDATGASAAGDGVGEGDATGTVSEDNAEFEPLMPGSDSSNAISMKLIAAPMVIFAKMF